MGVNRKKFAKSFEKQSKVKGRSLQAMGKLASAKADKYDKPSLTDKVLYRLAKAGTKASNKIKQLTRRKKKKKKPSKTTRTKYVEKQLKRAGLSDKDIAKLRR